MSNAEIRYLEMLERVMNDGEDRGDRTGTGTRSLFAGQHKCDLREGFPIMTTKRVHWKSIVVELLWFLRGDDDIQFLKEHGITIWDANAEDFAKKHPTITPGYIGPGYGAQWRHWGKKCLQWKSTEDIDQIAQLIERIKTSPEDRRLIVSAWNVGEIEHMALPPCHCFFQCYVSQGKFLDLHMYQRSADMLLGVPFNIASYALLMHIIGAETGLIPRFLTTSYGDYHIYSNHFEQVKEQLSREPYPLPQLAPFAPKGIDNYEVEDFQLVGYTAHAPIKAPMAV